jgi:hypothetical protein
MRCTCDFPDQKEDKVVKELAWRELRGLLPDTREAVSLGGVLGLPSHQKSEIVSAAKELGLHALADMLAAVKPDPFGDFGWPHLFPKGRYWLGPEAIKANLPDGSWALGSGSEWEDREGDPDICVGAEVLLGKHRSIDGIANWNHEMEQYAGTRAVIERQSGDPVASVRTFQVAGNMWAWRARDMVVLRTEDGLALEGELLEVLEGRRRVSHAALSKDQEIWAQRIGAITKIDGRWEVNRDAPCFGPKLEIKVWDETADIVGLDAKKAGIDRPSQPYICDSWGVTRHESPPRDDLNNPLLGGHPAAGKWTTTLW